MKNLLKNFIAVIAIFLAISAVAAFFAGPQGFQKTKEVSFSQLVKDINQGNIKQIKVSGPTLLLDYNSGQKAVSRKESGVALSKELQGLGVNENKLKEVEIKIDKDQKGVMSWLFPALLFILPLLIFGWFFFTIFKQAKGGASQAFTLLKSPAKLFENKKTDKEKITFKDIADLEEAKEEIKEVVDFLKNPKKYLKMGANIPRGVLLIGPPGTGKTMITRAVANESGVPFFSIAGSAFIELFVGVGSARVRSLFETAKRHQPSIVFIDELDAIGKIRTLGIGGGHEEREQTLNQILSEMDGFDRDTGVIVIGATNRPESLDPALLRPGRFDRRIVFDLPDVKGRKDILKIHCQKKPLSLDANLLEIAERTPGFSGADLANLTNEAAILAAKRNKKNISQKEFLESIEKVLLGPERKTHFLSKEEKVISAFHEAGHALISATLSKADTVRKVSIISRGLAAGYTLTLPKQEKKMKTKSEFLTDLAVLLGGYCSEKLIFKEISTGASNDLEKVGTLARNLVVKYGMSNLGPVSFGKRESLPFLGWEQETEKKYSEETAFQIDKETKRFIKEAENKTMKILKKKKKTLVKIAKVLIKKETIEKEEFESLVSPEKKSKSKQTGKQEAKKNKKISAKTKNRKKGHSQSKMGV